MAEEKSKTKKKIPWKKRIGTIIFFLTSVLCGLMIGEYINAKGTTDLSFWEFLVTFGILILLVVISIYLHIIIHEAGHLVFGLLSGYSYSSFRIGSLMWVKEDGKVRFKRLSLVGTEGQCLMSPPDLVNGKMPYVLYNLGGSFMNIIFSLVFLGTWLLCKDIPYLSSFLLTISIVGVLVALMNGIPMKLGAINNDGYNALSVSKNTAALRALWLQLKVGEQLSPGIRLKDMPEEWFVIPTDDEMKNALIAPIGIIAANRIMDMQNFGEAKELMLKLLAMDSAIIDLHRHLSICDIIYCELIDGNIQIDDMLDKKQKDFMKQMKKFPTVIRTEYAYALIAVKNSEKAEKIKAEFEKIAITYPYQSDIESERELIKIAKGK